MPPRTASRSRGTATAPLPVTSITFPSNGSAPTAPAGPVSIDDSRDDQFGRRGDAGDHRRALDLTERHSVRLALRRDRHVAGRLCRRQAREPVDREERHRDGDLFERPVQAGRADRTRHLPQPARPAPHRRQRLGAHLRLGRPDRRHARHRQPRRAAGRRARRVERRPDRRARRHDHRAARLPGQRADDQDAGPVLQTLVNLR